MSRNCAVKVSWSIRPNLSRVCFQVSPWDKREEANEKKLAFALAHSDHIALLQAYKVPIGSECGGDDVLKPMGTMGSLSVAGVVQGCEERQPGRFPLLQGELPVVARSAGQRLNRHISVTLLEKWALHEGFSLPPCRRSPV